ncbi:RHS repeat-associated core domain-containing protein [Paenibacillus sp. CF384]|uniref:RHS repeat-associated core domain-containing protein n=1 Tax=Paenibacillus sp. CF384 TaxID=1884382 RepID=UPI0008953EE5|nr:RHS repeat-associated core domain-containing protein [Paenibacillus sp. CF384]SDW22602.1 RHS repeat-associated core domain-containing protein [Paenibacillus sp. CF384]
MDSDASHDVLKKYSFDIWGNITSESSNPNKNFNNPFKYTGEIYDDESGLIYLRARYYDPSNGRFTTEDTYEGKINNPLSLNLYTYVHNNPLIYSDPTGHWCTSAKGQYSHAGTCNGGKDGGGVKGNVNGSTWTPDYQHIGQKEKDNYKPIGLYMTAQDLDMSEYWKLVDQKLAAASNGQAINITGKLGTGAAIKAKVMGIGVEFTPFKFYDSCDVYLKCGQTMELSLNFAYDVGIKITGSKFIDVYGKEEGSYTAAAFWGDHQIGWGQKDDLVDATLETSFGWWEGPGGEITLSIDPDVLFSDIRNFLK